MDVEARNVNIGFLQETNLTKGIHTRYGAGYAVYDMEAEIIHWGELR